MDSEKYNRSVPLLCPTCGSTQFSPVFPDDAESDLQKCISCGREITRDDLIRENSENINEHMNEIKEEVFEDVGKEIKKRLELAFKGNKFIKVK